MEKYGFHLLFCKKKEQKNKKKAASIKGVYYRENKVYSEIFTMTYLSPRIIFLISPIFFPLSCKARLIFQRFKYFFVYSVSSRNQFLSFHRVQAKKSQAWIHFTSGSLKWVRSALPTFPLTYEFFPLDIHFIF